MAIVPESVFSDIESALNGAAGVREAVERFERGETVQDVPPAAPAPTMPAPSDGVTLDTETLIFVGVGALVVLGAITILGS